MKEFDRKVFYDSVRHSLFGGELSQEQVTIMETIIDSWYVAKGQDYRHLAYVLATVKGECNFRLLSESHQLRTGKRYNEKHPKTGLRYYGRGLPQLTWYENYLKMEKLLGIPLTEKPDLMLELKTSVLVLLEGMYRGMSKSGDFTGHSLEDYFNKSTEDPVGARRIVNGTDRAGEFAQMYRQFKSAMEKAGMNPALIGAGVQILLNNILPTVLAQANVAPDKQKVVLQEVKTQAESHPQIETPKSQWSSKGIWGSILTIVIGGVGAYIGWDANEQVAVVTGLGTVLSGIVSYIGRKNATYAVK